MLLVPSISRVAGNVTIYHVLQSAKNQPAQTKRARHIPPPPLRHIDRFAPVCYSVAAPQPMRIAVEVLGRKLKQLGVFERFHLMHQSDRYVHAFARRELELLERRAF